MLYFDGFLYVSGVVRMYVIFVLCVVCVLCVLCVVCVCVLLCVFFQAEDGIRDLVRSRGLGDVYKRQVTGARFFLVAYNVNLKTNDQKVAQEIALRVRESGRVKKDAQGNPPVSYTHLTLPTSDLV